MECADRIATMAAERTLEPVLAMEDHDSLCAVTVRALLDRRRFDVTIRKAWPQGTERPPVYRWEVREVAADGAPTPGGLSVAGAQGADEGPTAAEDAYWLALEGTRAALDSAPA